MIMTLINMYFLVFILLISVIEVVRGECMYYSLYNKDISKTGDPGLLHKKPFGLVLAYGESLVRTEQKCIDFCNDNEWCIGTDDLTAYPNIPEFCQFITDWHLLEMSKTNKCTDQLNVFNCLLDQHMLINIDGDVFRVVDLDDTHGGHPSEHVMPSNLEVRDVGAGKFCHVLKNDNQIISSKATVYSDYYTTRPIVLNGWTDYNEIGAISNKVGDPNLFARRGASIPHNGFPIKGMSILNQKPYDQAYDFEMYTLLRNEILEANACRVPGPTDPKFYVSPEDVESGETFFHIISTLDDGTERMYLSCSVTNNDDQFACQWVPTPTMVWKMASFKKVFDPNNDCNGCGGYDKIFMAYDINDMSNELGWLDRSHCDSDLDNNKDQLRILRGGIPTDSRSGEGIHCGALNWKLARGHGDHDNLAKGHGTWLSRRNHYRAFAENDNVFAQVRGMHDEAPHSARLCGINVHETKHNEFNCGGQTRYNRIEVETIPNDTGASFFIIEDGADLKLYCPIDGSNCKWVSKTEYPDQYVKLATNGIGQSTVNPTNVGDEPFLGNTMMIHEKIDGFMTMLGYLGNTHLYDDNSLNVVIRPDPENPDTILNDPNTFFKFDDQYGIKIADWYKLVVGDENTDAKFVDLQESGTSPVISPFVIEFNGITEDDHYHWIMDTHDSLVDHMHMCPDGEHLHQIRCKTDQRCEHVDIACVKPLTNCAINTGANKTIHTLLEGQFATCPNDSVVVGWNKTHMACQNINIVQSGNPPGYTPRDFPGMGFITRNNIKATPVDKVHPKGNNWHGVPYQALRPSENEVALWHYGDACYVKFEDSNYNINGPSESIQRVNLIGKNHGVRCSSDHEFISFFSCQFENDCRRGLEITCDAAPKCKMTGEVVKIDTPVGEAGGICPFGTVLKGISCLSSSTNTEGEIIPCVRMELECARVEFDEHFDPGKPSKKHTSDDDTLKIILIGVGVGLPLLIVMGLVCLCCLPDPDTVPVQESALVKEYESFDSTDDTYNILSRF